MAAPNNAAWSKNPLPRLSTPAAIATGQHLQYRSVEPRKVLPEGVTVDAALGLNANVQKQVLTRSNRQAGTSQVSQSAGEDILAAQRRNRPISPHLSIYRPQVTWIPSAFNRITGSILSGTLYAFGAAYLVSPMFGWHLESASIAASFASLPIFAKVGLKMFYALPFTFHSLNGLRHLTWDVGAGLTNRQVIITGWTVIGLSVVSAIGLAFL